MNVATTRFGTVDIPDEKILRFPRGLLGFEQATQFFVVNHDEQGKLRWLQSAQNADLAFLIVDPQHFFADYIFELRSDYLPIIEYQENDELVTVVVLTVHGQGERITINLQAPIIFNARNLLGVQIICDEEQYGTQHQIYPTTGSSVLQQQVAASAEEQR